MTARDDDEAGGPTPEALDRVRCVLRGYALADRERRVERRWWMAAVVVAYVLGRIFGGVS